MLRKWITNNQHHRITTHHGRKQILYNRSLSVMHTIVRDDDGQNYPSTKTHKYSYNQSISVQWKDGHSSQYHFKWLVDNCRCRICAHSSGQRLEHTPHDKESLLKVDHEYPKFNIIQDGNAIHAKFAPEHEFTFSGKFLRNACYSNKVVEHEAKSLEALSNRIELPVIEYQSLSKAILSDTNKNHPSILPFLQKVNRYNICLIDHTPTELGTVEKIANLIGPCSHTIYGKTFDVVSLPNAINVAYSSEPLPPHQDLAYYESPPGLQLLHCIRFDPSVIGGESTFVDGHAAAELLKKKHPEAFRVLTRIPATFQKDHMNRPEPLKMFYQRPHIHVNHRDEVTAVFWAPPFEGPLRVSSKDTVDYYNAKEKFEEILTSQELWSNHGLIFRLKPGQLVIFNNRRMLHGRKGFTMPAASKSNDSSGYPTKTIEQQQEYSRHLQGAYLEIDNYLNKFRVLSALYPEYLTDHGASHIGGMLSGPGETRSGTTSYR